MYMGIYVYHTCISLSQPLLILILTENLSTFFLLKALAMSYILCKFNNNTNNELILDKSGERKHCLLQRNNQKLASNT